MDRVTTQDRATAPPSRTAALTRPPNVNDTPPELNQAGVVEFGKCRKHGLTAFRQLSSSGVA